MGIYPAIVVSQTLSSHNIYIHPFWVAVYATQLSLNDFVVLLPLSVSVSHKKIVWCTPFPRNSLHRSALPSIRVSITGCTFVLKMILKMKTRTATASVSVILLTVVGTVTSNHCSNSGGIYHL